MLPSGQMFMFSQSQLSSYSQFARLEVLQRGTVQALPRITMLNTRWPGDFGCEGSKPSVHIFITLHSSAFHVENVIYLKKIEQKLSSHMLQT